METAFYFYTILVMLACIAAGMISLSAYFVSRRRLYLYVVSFFLFYFLDLALIFQYEYLGQNIEYSLEFFYAIDQPALKTFFALGVLESLWLIICDYLNKQTLLTILAPAGAFIVASCAILWFVPEGALQQWLFYSSRQFFLLGCLVFVLVYYLRSKSEVERIRLRRLKWLFLFTFALVICIIVEDTLMILAWNPGPQISVTLLPLYISERNFSENFLMIMFAFVSLKEAAAILRLRFKEPPASENPVLQQHIDNLLPTFCDRHRLTARECDIIALVLSGKDNQNIASELQLALGTIKAHVHNILKKTNHATRQELIRDFWKE